MTHAAQHQVLLPSGDAVISSLEPRSAFAFSSPTRTLIDVGPLTPIEASVTAQQFTALKRFEAMGTQNACIVGCYPFQRETTTDAGVPEPARLFIAPHTLVGAAMPWSATDDRAALEAATPASRTEVRSTEVVPSFGWHIEPSRQEQLRADYCRSVTGVLSKIREQQVEKVVLSRVLDLVPHYAQTGARCRLNAAQMTSLVRGVLLRQPARYGFAVRLSASDSETSSRISDTSSDDSRWFFGLSPELLVKKQGAQVESFPLAGSCPRVADARLDTEHAAGLLSSEKDLREHNFVVQAIADTLSPFCTDLRVPKRPELVATSTLWHLGTPIRGTLRDGSVPSHTLALALHPTPAICGTPTQAAMGVIRELEAFRRDYFTGMVGWCDAVGDGEWAIAIRCGELTNSRLRLYAGAGVVSGSDPDAEWLETEAKLRTLLRALRINPVPDSD